MRWASPRQHSGLPRDLAIAVVGIVVFGSVLAVPMTWVAERVLGAALPWADRLASGSTVTVPPLPERSTIHAADGSILATLFEENREVVPLDQVRPVTRRAVLAIEDAGFFRHYGIDPAAVARATLTNLASGEITEGASTITQQLARNTIPGVGTEETLGRKVVEAVTAMGLERRYSKTQILELYLNETYFGSGAHGIAAASERYFAKPPERLTSPRARSWPD